MIDANEMKAIALAAQREQLIAKINDTLSSVEEHILEATEEGRLGFQLDITEWPSYMRSAIKHRLLKMGYDAYDHYGGLHISWVKPRPASDDVCLTAVKAKLLTDSNERRLRYSYKRGVMDFLESNIEYAAAQGHTDVLVPDQYWDDREFREAANILINKGFRLDSIPPGLVIGWDEPYSKRGLLP